MAGNFHLEYSSDLRNEKIELKMKNWNGKTWEKMFVAMQKYANEMQRSS